MLKRNIELIDNIWKIMRETKHRIGVWQSILILFGKYGYTLIETSGLQLTKTRNYENIYQNHFNHSATSERI
jgi:hypothetical protein